MVIHGQQSVLTCHDHRGFKVLGQDQHVIRPERIMTEMVFKIFRQDLCVLRPERVTTEGFLKFFGKTCVY